MERSGGEIEVAAAQRLKRTGHRYRDPLVVRARRVGIRSIQRGRGAMVHQHLESERLRLEADPFGGAKTRGERNRAIQRKGGEIRGGRDVTGPA